MLSEKVACATVSLHLYFLSYTQMQCYPPFRHLNSDFGDFSNGYGILRRLVPLKVILSCNSDHDEYFALALTFSSETIRC